MSSAFNPADFVRYRVLVIATLLVLAIGTVFYHYVEGFAWVDAYYFCVVTLATVGYGDYVPHTEIGKIFTTFYIFFGVGIITTFITVTVRRRAKIAASRHGGVSKQDQTDRR